MVWTQKLILIFIAINSWISFGYAETKTTSRLCSLLVADENPDLSSIEKNQFQIKKTIHATFEKNKQAFAEQLGDKVFLIKKENNTSMIYYSITKGSYVPHWLPLKARISTLVKPNQKLSCKQLQNMVNENRYIREASYAAIKYLINGKSNHLSLGETIIRLEMSYAKNKKAKNLGSISKVVEKYNVLLSQSKKYVDKDITEESFFKNWRFIMENVYDENKSNINYCAEKTLMSEALISNCTNCIGETSLFLSLFIDLKFKEPKDWILSIQLFDDHVRPVLFNKNKKQVFDLVYGRFSDPTSAIFKWQDFMLPLLKGTQLLLGENELQFIQNKEFEHVYSNWFCNREYRDPGYEHLVQAFDFSFMKSCAMFGAGDLPTGIVDTQSRLLNYMSEENKSSWLASWIRPNMQFSFENTASKDKRDEAEDANRLLAEIKHSYLKFVDNLSVNELDVIDRALKTKKIDEVIKYVNPKPFINHLGLKDNSAIKYEIYNTQALRPLNIHCLEDPKETIYVQDGNLALYAMIPSGSDCENIKKTSTVERYKKVYDLLKKEYYLLSRGLERSFDDSNVPESLIEQHNNKIKNKAAFIIAMSAENLIQGIPVTILKADSRNIHSTLVDTVKDQIPFYNEIGKINKQMESFAKIFSEPIQTISYIKAAQDRLKVDVLELFPYVEKYDLKAYTTYDMIVLNIDAIAQYQKEFIYGLLFHKDYFFTAIDQKYENLEFKTIEDLIDSQNTGRARSEHISTLPKVNLPKVNFKCGDNDVGYVQRGFLYIECPGKKPQEIKDHNQKNKSSFDIREMVIIDTKYWQTIISANTHSFYADSLLSLALHHMQTEAIANVITDYVAPDLLWVPLNVITPSLKSKMFEANDAGSIEELIKRSNNTANGLYYTNEVSNKMEENFNYEKTSGELLYYEEYPFLRKAVEEVDEGLKVNWKKGLKNQCQKFASQKFYFECEKSQDRLMEDLRKHQSGEIGVFDH